MDSNRTDIEEEEAKDNGQNNQESKGETVD